MVQCKTNTRASIYDSLPVLDLWYQNCQTTRAPETAPTVARPTSENRRSVSFSTEPPAIHYIDTSPEEYDCCDLKDSAVETDTQEKVKLRVKKLANKLRFRPNKVDPVLAV